MDFRYIFGLTDRCTTRSQGGNMNYFDNFKETWY